MHPKPGLDRPTFSALLSLLLVVVIPYVVLTFAAPGGRGIFLFFAFPLWAIGLRPADRMMSRLFPVAHGGKPQKALREFREVA
jgi:hypothetical protein